MGARVDLVAGARPNFMKVAAVHRALSAASGALEIRIVHTGQHYDAEMNDVFFEQLGIPPPGVHLEVGSGPQGAQTAWILERYEAAILGARPRATVVFGDVNSTLASALAAVKLGVDVVHVEAGLRSFDRTMPEEINRLVTDALSSLLLVSEPSGVANLAREGIRGSSVRLVGNVMIDTLRREAEAAARLEVGRGMGLSEYGLVTLHRPANVDEPAVLERLIRLLVELSTVLPLVFPMHPRTRESVRRAGLEGLLFSGASTFKVVEPLPYRENLSLMSSARLVLTDSGGMQEETTVLGVPCITLRDTTERPITVERGTSRLVGNDVEKIRAAFRDALSGSWPRGETIPLWDGAAAPRVASAFLEWLEA